jgi:hypothetical protein
MKDTRFFKQADLLVQVLPFVHAEPCFALKGGTAINFFVRDFPRLSVDIDLVFCRWKTAPPRFAGSMQLCSALRPESGEPFPDCKSGSKSYRLRTSPLN